MTKDSKVYFEFKRLSKGFYIGEGVVVLVTVVSGASGRGATVCCSEGLTLCPVSREGSTETAKITSREVAAESDCRKKGARRVSIIDFE